MYIAISGFWSGRNRQGENSTFEGKEGFEVLTGRMKAGTRFEKLVRASKRVYSKLFDLVD